MNAPRILKPGRNCWRVEHADRAACLIDGERYFGAFRACAMRAERSILIIGWDIDSRFDLARDRPSDGLPARFGEFLPALLQRRKSLRIHALDWDYFKLYAPERDWLSFATLGWRHRRLHYRMDSHYPAGACHHQKIVVVDDRVAFAGGFDFALGRWDTCEHRPDDPCRRERTNAISRPYHDVQLMVSGSCAAALGDLARERWHTATGRRLEPPALRGDGDPWPADVAPDFTDVRVGIARTRPQYLEQDPAYEVHRLLIDAIRAAQRTIYIEAQYLTAESIGSALASRLDENAGLEVVIVLPRRTTGWLSEMTMDVLRERLIRRLHASDGEDRLRIYYPDHGGPEEQSINVHSKVMIIDDTLLRIGSANLNRRSLRLDTECDLAVEAGGDTRIAHRIAAVRDRLVAEHLDLDPAQVADALSRHRGSLVQAIDALRGKSDRTLEPLGYYVTDEVDVLVPASGVADPDEPIAPEYVAEHLVDGDHRSAKTSIVVLTAMLALVLAIAAACRWTPLGEAARTEEIATWFGLLRDDWRALPLVIAAYVGAGLVVFPVTVMIIVTGAVFGTWPGFAYAMLGALASAAVTYAVGHFLGRAHVQRLPGRWVPRIKRRLARQGVLAMITLRIVPVAPFTVVNLTAGASDIPFRSFVLGTVIGMAPATLAFTAFSDQLFSTLVAPAVIRIVALVALTLLIAVGAWWLASWINRRQREGSGRAHRQADAVRGQPRPL